MFASPVLFVRYIGQLDVLEENSGLENSLTLPATEVPCFVFHCVLHLKQNAQTYQRRRGLWNG